MTAPSGGLDDRDAVLDLPAQLCQDLLAERSRLLGSLLATRVQVLVRLERLSPDPQQVFTRAALERELAHVEYQIGTLRYGVSV